MTCLDITRIAWHLALAIAVVHGEAISPDDIDLTGNYKCILLPDNQFILELLAYDVNGNAVRMNAVNEDKVEITTCDIIHSTNFYMETKINMTNDNEVVNVCGMTVSMDGGVKVYSWMVKAYTYPLGGDVNRRGFVLYMACRDDQLDSRVETLVDIIVSDLEVTAANTDDITGPNTVATGADIVYTATLYPNGRSVPASLNGAEGIYSYDCFSATNPNMQQNREHFIDENGCPIDGATYAPTTGFTSYTNTDDMITIQAIGAKSEIINGKKQVYISCLMGKCFVTGDPKCTDRCAAHTNNASSTGVDTGYEFTSNFYIQDQQAQQLSVTTSDGASVLRVTNVGTIVQLIVSNSPYGIGGTTELIDAKGFFVYNCLYSTNQPNTDAVQFVDAGGCTVPDTILSPTSNFVFDEALSSVANNLFVLKTGLIRLQNKGNLQLTVRCDTGKCITDGHNYCIQRCNAVTNNTGAVNLGDQGLSAKLSILDTVTEPAATLSIISESGNVGTVADPIPVGANVNIGATVTPGGTGSASASFNNMFGIALHTCSVTRDGVTSMFIDEQGCPVEGSPYKTSGKCLDATVDGVPPFVVDCQSFVAPEEGEFTQECHVIGCTTRDNLFCKDRCAAGEIQPDSNVVDNGVTVTNTFFAEKVNLSRTAERSDALRTLITVSCIVAALLFLAAVVIGTCIVMNKQKAKSKGGRQRRRYNYN